MPDADIAAALADIFRRLFNRPDLHLSPTLSAADIEGWDSLRQIEIILACEERFGIIFSLTELDRLQNVGDLIAVVSARTSADTTP